MYLILLMTSVAALAIAQAPDAAQSPAQPGAAETGDNKPACRNPRTMITDGATGNGGVGNNPPLRARRLDEMPAGDLQLAVMREVDGCIEPTIVRQGYGAVAPPERR